MHISNSVDQKGLKINPIVMKISTLILSMLNIYFRNKKKGTRGLWRNG